MKIANITSTSLLAFSVMLSGIGLAQPQSQSAVPIQPIIQPQYTTPITTPTAPSTFNNPVGTPSNAAGVGVDVGNGTASSLSSGDSSYSANSTSFGTVNPSVTGGNASSSSNINNPTTSGSSAVRGYSGTTESSMQTQSSQSQGTQTTGMGASQTSANINSGMSNPGAGAVNTTTTSASNVTSQGPVSTVSSLALNQQFGYANNEIIVGSSTTPSVTPRLIVGVGNTSILVLNPTPQPATFSSPALNINAQIPPNGARVVQVDNTQTANLTPGQPVAYYINNANGDVIASSELVNNQSIVSLINTNTQFAYEGKSEPISRPSTRRHERRSTVRGYW